MTLIRPVVFFSFAVACALFLWVSPGSGNQEIVAAPHPLPYVSLDMEKPGFWVQKIESPASLLLDSQEIEKMNEENLGREDLFLWKVKDLKTDWSREELIAFFKEDWDGFAGTGKTHYGGNGNALDQRFWDELRKNTNQDSLREKNPLLFGLIVRRTDIRFFPTDKPTFVTPLADEFDRSQHSSISPGSLVGVYTFSKDQRWAYVQTSFVRGWVNRDALAIAADKTEAVGYQEVKDRLVITGSDVNVYGDPALREKVFDARMGTSFPLLSLPLDPSHQDSLRNDTGAGDCYVIRVPTREADGKLNLTRGYIRKGDDVHHGFLPYTQRNVAEQAFKMLHQPYGWGERGGGRDCSRFIMDIFAAFGIVMPRNSRIQAKIGTDLGSVEGESIKKKKRVLDRAIPLASIIRLPGHIMLYLGKHQGRHFVIHSIWGIQKVDASGLVLEKIGKNVVSDLSLGESGLNGSLFDRITNVRFIGKANQ